MTARAEYDCTNRECVRYQEIRLAPLKLLDHGEQPPRCVACRHTLRLLHVRRAMPDGVKAILRERASQRRMA